jgi:hypothetical protein
MLQLITSIDQARANILSYHDAFAALHQFPGGVRASLLNTVSHAQVWVAINRGRWLAAPAKWVGYANVAPQSYHTNRRHISGSKAARRLEELGLSSEPLADTHGAAHALNTFAGSHGKAPRDGHGIYLLPGENLPSGDREMVDAWIRLIEKADLPDEAMEYLSERVAAIVE